MGVKKPKCEYLVDEDDTIRTIYCWHIREAFSSEQIKVRRSRWLRKRGQEIRKMRKKGELPGR